jgi:hypothetical protein
MSSCGEITDVIFFATRATESSTSNASSIIEIAIAASCTPYVLMSNHVHLLIATGAVGLSKIMQGIQFRYTQR